jgi:peptidoglycan/LPS O-acetylase OafA/YrhL
LAGNVVGGVYEGFCLTSANLNYKPHVDGLRAVAVIPVLLYHAQFVLGGWPVLSGGYCGVDVFFVISGYLITGIILKDLTAGAFSIVQFWERRIRRILPVLTVVVVVCLLAGWCLYLPDDFEDLGKSAVAQGLVVSNFYFWRGAGYFAANADTKPLLHTWSLAVEEQFYLLFPWLLLLIYRPGMKRLLGWLLGLGLASFVVSCLGVWQMKEATFYLLPFRAWELILGALIAVHQSRATARPLGQRAAEALSALGLVAVGVALVMFDDRTPFPGVAAVLPCGGAALILWANAQNRTWVGRMLAVKPLVGIGLISYSLYLWHWPVLVFGQYWNEDASAWYRGGLLLGSAVLAVVTWKFVELPYRERKWFPTRRGLFGYGVAATALVVGLGALVVGFEGGPGRVQSKAMEFVRQKRAAIQLRSETTVSLQAALAGEFIPLGPRTGQVKLLVWGDSHAGMLIPVLEDMCKQYAVRGVMATHGAAPPILDRNDRPIYQDFLKKEYPRYTAAIMDYIQKQDIHEVLMVARWARYAEAADKPLLRADLEYTVATLRAAGVRVWVLKQVPEQKTDATRALAWATIVGGQTDTMGVTRAQHQEKYAGCDDYLVAGLRPPGVVVLDPTGAYFDSRGYCALQAEGNLIYFDRNHVTPYGARRLVGVLAPMFGELAGDGGQLRITN